MLPRREREGALGHEADPELVAELARALLTGEAGDDAGRASEHDRLGVTFKGIVGLEAKARGLDVVLEVYKDEELFQAVAEIVVTNPGSAEGALVRVTDGGEVTWERDYWPEAAAISWEPEYAWWIADPAKAAESIVTAITQAMSLTDRVGG